MRGESAAVSYEVRIVRRADKAIDRLPSTIQDRVEVAIDSLAEDPRPRGSRKLRGVGKEDRRLRIGDYRVVYRVEEPYPDAAERHWDGVVTVLAVGHRQSIYG